MHVSKPSKPPLALVDDSTTAPAPPRELGKHGRVLWDRVHSEYRIEDYGGIELFTQACQALDRVEDLSACIARDGAVIRTKTGLRSHPAIRDEIALRGFIVKTLIRLGINVEAIGVVGRPSRGFGWAPDAD